MKINQLVILLVILLLSSCSILGPIKQENQNVYVIDTLPSGMSKYSSHGGTILVLQPETRPVFNTTQMAYTDKPYQISYFSENQWAETPSMMLYPLLVQSLQNTNYFHAVVVPPFTGKYQYVLSTQILKLQQNFMHQSSFLEMKVRVQLSNVLTGQLVATRQYSIKMPMPQKSPYGGVIAANRAAASIMRQIAEFCVAHAR